MTQVIPFNPALGGTTPNMCLANVCAGYSIPNKYGSAWEAWQHTEQHTDPVPDGLDVPLYYSYTVDLGQGAQNYGHINVRLANGTVWSDGNIYASVDAYLANHWPKYVGWGTSINDVTIIQEGAVNMPSVVDLQTAQMLFQAYWEPEQIAAAGGDAFVAGWVGTESNSMIQAFANSAQWRNKRLDTEQVAAELKDAQAQIATLEGQGGAGFTPVPGQLYYKN
jgi:hypothetical protein